MHEARLQIKKESRASTGAANFRTRLVSALAHRYAAPAIILVGLILRVFVLAQLATKGLMSDAASYNNMASQLLGGDRFIPFWPPGLPLYLALVKGLFGSEQWIARASMSIFYIGLSLAVARLVFLLTRRRWISSVALAILAFAPSFILASVETTTELPTAMLLALVAVMLVKQETTASGRWNWSIGTLLGGLVLVRPANLILLLAVPILLLIKKRKLSQCAPVIVIPLAIVGCWIGFVAHQTGRLVMVNTSNSKNMYLGNSDRTPLYRTWWLGSHHDAHETLPGGVDPEKMDPIALNAEYSRLATSAIKQHPLTFVLRTFNRICVYFALDTFTGAYLIETYGYSKLLGLCVIALDALVYTFAMLGSICFVVTQGKDIGSKTSPWVLVALTLLYAAPYFISFSHPRYHFAILPLLLTLSMCFIERFIGAQKTVIRDVMAHRMKVIATAFAVFISVQLEFVYIVLRHRS